MPDFSCLSDGSVVSFEELVNLADGKCVKRPRPIQFFVAAEPYTFYLNRGEAGVDVQHAAPGDVVVIGEGYAWVVTREYFFKNYDVILNNPEDLIPAQEIETHDIPQTC